MSTNKYLKFITQLPFLAIIITSFIYFSPTNYFDFNSDHAIQSLMSTSFNFKRDFFYWGQNRLGSFLPMITYPIYKLTHAHPLYIISIVHYLLLLISCLLLSKFTSNYFIKLSIYTIVFFPFSDYRAIIFIGHPYSVQLFCGSIFIYTLIKLYRKSSALLYNEDNDPKYLNYSFVSIICALSFSIGFWASELNAVLILIPFFFVIFELRYFLNSLKLRFVQITLGIIAITTSILLRVFFVMKNTFPKDEMYDHPFFFTKTKISQQYNFFKVRFLNFLSFGDNQPYDNFYYYLVFTVIIIYIVLCRKQIKNNLQFNSLFNSINLTVLITFIMLFFSTWNLRSEYCPRYYTPVYFMFFIALLIAINKFLNKKITTLIGLVFIFYSLLYNYYYLKGKPSEGVFNKYSEFQNLPKGTLIAGYWDSYVIASVAYKTITPVPFHDHLVRNGFMIEDAFSNSNFYFIKNKEFTKYGFGDTIMQHNSWLVYTGKKYNINSQEVLLYKKL